EYKPGDSIQATIQADNLFGTPAAGRYYECMLDVRKSNFTSTAFPDYSFAISNDIYVNFDYKTGKTGADGSAKSGFTIPATTAYTGVLKGNLMCAVSDETGRPVHRYQPITVYTQPAFIGIR